MKNVTSVTAVVIVLAAPGYAAQGPAEPDPGRTYQVEGNIHVAVVENRNSVYLVSDERVLLTETNFERNAVTVAGLIASVTPNPVQLVVNTHWHGDHVGGNAYFAERGAALMAHENTRVRMSEQQVNPVTGRVQLEAQALEFLPTVTFKDGVTIHWGDETVELVHYPDAHTDSDVVIYFHDANVIMVGGLLEYPTYAGVSDPEGFIDALEKVIARADADSKIIPWKGPVISEVELQEWRDVIETMAANVSALIAEGKTIDEIVAAHPSAEFDAKWGGGRTPNRFAQDMHYVLTHGAQD